MGSIQFTLYAIFGLVGLLLVISFSEQFKSLFTFVLRATLGILTFSAVNILFAGSNFYIASNVFTVCISGFLGLYGVIALILSSIIL